MPKKLYLLQVHRYAFGWGDPQRARNFGVREFEKSERVQYGPALKYCQAHARMQNLLTDK